MWRAIILLVAASSTYAQMNACINADGSKSFTDRPCSATGARPAPNKSPSLAASGSGPAVMSPEHRRQIIENWEKSLQQALKAPPAVPRQSTAHQPPLARAKSSAMPFPQCTALLRSTVIQLAGTGRTKLLAATSQVAMLRVCTDDGSVLLSCSALDQTLVTTPSNERSGC